MPRSPDEKRRLAIKYGRRQRLAAARSSRKLLDKEVAHLLRQLKASAVPREKANQLRATLKASTDDRRRGGAIWAIVDALEAAER